MKRASLNPHLDLALEPPAETEPTKLCTGCGVHHPLSRFLPTKFTNDGLTDVCLKAIRQRSEQDRLAREKRYAEARAKAPKSKTCKTCNKRKPLTDFSRHRLSADGHVHRCKACTKAGRAKPQQRTPEQAARQRELAAEPHRRVANRVAVKSWMERHPEACAARRAVRQAIERGDLTPAPTCQVLGCEEKKLDAHHANYSRPLAVLWICRSHHRQAHAGYRPKLKPGVDPKLLRIPKPKAKRNGRQKAKG